MDCAQTLARLWEYLDDELPSPVRSAVRAHLDGCPTCYIAWVFDDAFLNRLRALRAVLLAAPVGLRPRVEAQVRGAQAER